METLKVGMKGDSVKELQKLLGITADGDFGKATEAKVKEFQTKNKLTADGVVGSKTWEKLKDASNKKGAIGEGIEFNPIYVHITKSVGRKIKYLVIHFTAGGSSKKGSAESNRKVFLTRDASADFCVDDETIIQVNPDPANYYCWAVGDGKGKLGIWNKDCISIEICSNLKKGTTAKVPNHEGWFFTDKSIENAVKLSKIIMDKYHIDIDHVIRHYDATHKLCPGIIGWNPGPIYDCYTGGKTKVLSVEDDWKEFKNKLK